MFPSCTKNYFEKINKYKKIKLHVALLMAHCKVEELQRIQVTLLQLGDKESGIQAKLQPAKSFFY